MAYKYGMNTFFINGNSTFINGPRSLPSDLPDCIILDSCIFDTIIFADESFVKALQRIQTSKFNSKLFVTLVSLVPIIYFDNFRVISVAFVIADFNLPSFKFKYFTFTL